MIVWPESRIDVHHEMAPGERRVFELDAVNLLAAGEVPASLDAEILRVPSFVPDPTCLDGGPSVVGTRVLQAVHNLVRGRTYWLEVVFTAEAGVVIGQTFLMRVQIDCR